MVGAAVHAVDDREGGTLQLVVETASEKPADDRIAARLGVEHEFSRGAIKAALAQAAMDALDDVAALAERAQRRLRVLGHDPLSGADRRREAELLQLAGAGDKRGSLGILSPVADRSQIDHPIMAGGLARERLIERRPAIGVDLPLQSAADFLLAAGTKLQRDELLGAGAEAPADIVAIDHQIAAVVGSSANQDMDMWMLGVPMIDRHPIDRRAEIARHFCHEIAREGAKVGELGGVIGRDDESKMVSVVLAAFGESARVRLVARRVEHSARRAVARDAVAAKIGQVSGERRGFWLCRTTRALTTTPRDPELRPRSAPRLAARPRPKAPRPFRARQSDAGRRPSASPRERAQRSSSPLPASSIGCGQDEC